MQRDVVLEDPGTETPADQAIGRTVDTEDQGVSIETDQILTREIAIADPGVAEPADQTVDRIVNVDDQAVTRDEERTAPDPVEPKSVPQPGVDGTASSFVEEMLGELEERLSSDHRLGGDWEWPDAVAPQAAQPGESAAAPPAPVAPAASPEPKLTAEEKAEKDRQKARDKWGAASRHATEVGNEFQQGFADRSKTRNDERMGAFEKRMQAGDYVPKSIQEKVSSWREGQKPEIAASPQPAAVVPQPVMPAPVMPRAAAPVAQIPGREMLAELRQIKTWLAQAELGIS